MAELFDTAQVRDDASYWDALAERVAEHAAHASTERALEWLGRSRASWVVASLLVAAALVLIVMPPSKSLAQSRSAEWTDAIAPTDEMGKAIGLPDRPPPIDALLLVPHGRR